MANKAAYVEGVKVFQPLSEFYRADPYFEFHKTALRGKRCYQADVDSREIRCIAGEFRTVAYIERECCPERIKFPLKYLESFWGNADMRVKLDSLAHDARQLDIPAYFVAHSSDMQQFIVVRLPWDGKTYRQGNAQQYIKFIESLGRKEKAA